jgi:hypothetical protein
VDPNIQSLLHARRMIDDMIAKLMRIPTDPNAEPSDVFPSGPVYPQTERSRIPGRESGMGGVDRHPPLPTPKPLGLLV